MSLNNNLNKILIIDFGSQFTQLIVRRVRELGVFSEILNHKKANNLKIFNKNIKNISAISIFLKTLGFTYLNPHVYSDTVFFLGNFSKNFSMVQKLNFGIGASIASFLFFFTIGYLSTFLSKHLISEKIWKIINLFIIIFMSLLFIYVLKNILLY